MEEEKNLLVIEKKEIDLIKTTSSSTLFANVQNAILRGYYDLSSLAQKLMLKDIGLAGQKARKYELYGKAYTGNKFYIVDFFKDFEIEDGGKTREGLKKALSELTSFKIGLSSENGSIVFLNLYQASKIDAQEGSVTVYYSNPMIEFLSNQPQYTKIDFLNITKLSNKYSLRWYTIISMYKFYEDKEIQKSFWRIFELSEIRKMFKVEKKYQNETHFKQKVIEEPIEEINQANTQFKIEINYLKNEYKKITKLKIFVQVKEVNFNDIHDILDFLGTSISQNVQDFLLENKERYLKICKSNYDFLIQKPVFNSDNIVEQEKAKNFYLDSIKQLKENLIQEAKMLEKMFD